MINLCFTMRKRNKTCTNVYGGQNYSGSCYFRQYFEFCQRNCYKQQQKPKTSVIDVDMEMLILVRYDYELFLFFPSGIHLDL